MALADVIFPVAELPEPAFARRLVGLYEQKDGNYMQRLRIEDGVLSGGQWRELAEIVERFTPGGGLHLTTRQDLEFHAVSPADVPALQRRLADAGVTTVGACGDTLRGITVSYENGFERGSFDVSACATAVREALWGHPEIARLPRKFKISFSSSIRATAQPYVGELGFIAHERDGAGGFAAVGAGSLGLSPSPGIGIVEWIAPGEVVPLTLAAVEMFVARGDRTDRKHARLRHVRERMGDAAFRAELLERFETLRRNFADRAIELPRVATGRREVAAVPFLCGDIAPGIVREIARAIDDGLAARIRNDHAISFFGEIAPDEFRDRYPALAARIGAARIVACPGAPLCSRALTNTKELAARIAESFPTGRSDDYVIRISGCPNACAHSGVAAVGLTGARKDGREAYFLWTGGGDGMTGVAAVRGERIAAADVVGTIGKLSERGAYEQPVE